jgi:hypothetical protein
MQLAQELGEVPIARFGSGGLEGATERRHDAGMGRWSFDANEPTIHSLHILFRILFPFEIHYPCTRANCRGSFLPLRQKRPITRG